MEGFDLSTISDVYVGSTQYSEIYYGSNKVWPTDQQYNGFCRLTLDDDSVVELQGSGNLTATMTDPYRSSVVNAEIGTQCTSIGENAFVNSSNLTNVTVSNSVTRVQYSAFNGCSSLTSINLSSNCTTIGVSAFNGCSSLVDVGDLSGITTLEHDAFNGCSSLTSINLFNITRINDRIFNGCTNLVSVGDLSKIEGSIGSSAFENCYKLKRVNLTNKVTAIGDDSFWYCKELEDVGDVSNVTKCVDGAFNGCKKLKSLNFSNKFTTIAHNYRAFSGCESITSFGDLSGLTGTVGGFTECKSITEYPTFKNSTTTILNNYTFESNTSLTTITLPSTITTIQKDVFFGDNQLQSIYFTSSVPPTLHSQALRENNAILYVPAEALEDYQNADVWKDYYLNRIQPYYTT